MKNLDQIAQDLFNKIRGRFESVTIGDDEGHVTDEPAEARFYDFQFEENGSVLGPVSVALFNDTLSIIYDDKISDSGNDTVVDSWFNFLRDMRQFAKRRLLSFDTRNIKKSNLNKRDYQFLSHDTVVESKMYGTKHKSFQKIGNATLCINHSRSINQDTPNTRARNIDSIFVESEFGERFKYPYNHLKGARAMARHVSEGGNPYDEFGKHIIELNEELTKLNKFKRHVNRSSVVSEGLSEYIDAASTRISDIKSELSRTLNPRFYKHIKETYENIILEDIPEEIQVDWVDKLTIKHFNEELKDVFPYVYRLISEHRKPEDIDPEYFYMKTKKNS